MENAVGAVVESVVGADVRAGAVSARRSEPAARLFVVVEQAAAGLYADVATPGGIRGDSGIDLRFAKDAVIAPGWRPTVVDLEMRARCRVADKYVPYMIAPRSSISKTPLSLANSVGVVDAGYQGTLRVALRNHSDEPWKISRGDALFQIILPDLSPAVVSVVNGSHAAFGAATERGPGGFGSTGVAGAGGRADGRADGRAN